MRYTQVQLKVRNEVRRFNETIDCYRHTAMHMTDQYSRAVLYGACDGLEHEFDMLPHWHKEHIKEYATDTWELVVGCQVIPACELYEEAVHTAERINKLLHG